MDIDWTVYGPIAAWAGVAVAALAWATTTWLTIRQVRRLRKLDEWRRLSELAGILHNGTAEGRWRQQLAIQELKQTPRSRRSDALVLITQAITHWRDSAPDLARQLEQIQAEFRR